MTNANLRTVRLALETVGSETALAEALGVTVSLVQRWLSGDEPASDLYLIALDTIVAKGRAY